MRFKAFVDSAINCPFCNAKYDDYAWMQWGLCGVAGSNFADYRPGDAVRWRTNFGSPPPPWTRLFPSWLWEGDVQRATTVPMNIGDPSIRDFAIEDARFHPTVPSGVPELWRALLCGHQGS